MSGVTFKKVRPRKLKWEYLQKIFFLFFISITNATARISDMSVHPHGVRQMPAFLYVSLFVCHVQISAGFFHLLLIFYLPKPLYVSVQIKGFISMLSLANRSFNLPFQIL